MKKNIAIIALIILGLYAYSKNKNCPETPICDPPKAMPELDEFLIKYNNQMVIDKFNNQVVIEDGMIRLATREDYVTYPNPLSLNEDIYNYYLTNFPHLVQK